MVGSGMATGEWTGSGKWQEVAEAAMEIPSSLQQIESNDLTKIKELGRGQFGSVWLCRSAAYALVYRTPVIEIAHASIRHSHPHCHSYVPPQMHTHLQTSISATWDMMGAAVSANGFELNLMQRIVTSQTFLDRKTESTVFSCMFQMAWSRSGCEGAAWHQQRAEQR